MANILHFEDLECWKASRKLVTTIYILCRKENLRNRYGLSDQIKRAGLSVMNNIAEGFERHTNKDRCHFLIIASASCSEVRSMLYVLLDLKIITEEEFSKHKEQTLQTHQLVKGFLRYLSSKK